MTPGNKSRSPSDKINPLCKCFFGKGHGFGFRFEGGLFAANSSQTKLKAVAVFFPDNGKIFVGSNMFGHGNLHYMDL